MKRQIAGTYQIKVVRGDVAFVANKKKEKKKRISCHWSHHLNAPRDEEAYMLRKIGNIFKSLKP